MPRAPKPAAVIKAEGKAHRTKAELEQREKQEKALLSGSPLFEREMVAKNPTAHKEYLRLKKLLKAIEKDDALYAPQINRYCELFAEERNLKAFYAGISELLNEIQSIIEKHSDDWESDEIADISKQTASLLRQLAGIDAQIMQHRTMMMKIESENCMTVAAALRTIPKDVTKEETDTLAKILAGE